MSLPRLVFALVALAACAHGKWIHRPLQATVWPLAFMDVPDFSDADQRPVDPLIVGGQDATKSQFPHQVSMQITGSPYRTQHICGGTVIAPSWVLTAAHCAWGVPEYTSVFVLAGKTDLSKNEANQQTAYVSDMYAHKEYRTNWNRGVGPNDVALLKLLTPLTFSDAVKAAKLPARGSIPTGQATLSGWGSISMLSSLELPDVLQTAVLPISDFKTCNAFIDKLQGTDDINPLRDTNVCAGPLDKAGLSSCQGDSGGPLIQTTTSGDVEVIGIVSWGYTPCGRIPSPSVFTRVSAFNDWIEDTMAKNS